MVQIEAVPSLVQTETFLFSIQLLEIKTDLFITFDQFFCYIINSHSCDRTFGPVLGQERSNCLAAICAFENAVQRLHATYFCMNAYRHILL